jgi:hypothetical protein
MEKYGKAGSIAESRSSLGVVPRAHGVVLIVQSRHWLLRVLVSGSRGHAKSRGATADLPPIRRRQAPQLLSILIVTEIMERRIPPNTESHADERLPPANTNPVPQKRTAGYDLSRAVRRKTKVIQIP